MKQILAVAFCLCVASPAFATWGHDYDDDDDNYEDSVSEYTQEVTQDVQQEQYQQMEQVQDQYQDQDQFQDQSQSSSSSSSNDGVNNSVNIIESARPNKITIKSTPTIGVPSIQPTISCYKTAAGGLVVPNLGLSFGGGKVDQGCVDREMIRIAAEMGEKKRALFMWCSNPDVARVWGSVSECLDFQDEVDLAKSEKIAELQAEMDECRASKQIVKKKGRKIKVSKRKKSSRKCVAWDVK